jgi:hypothetical protein
MKLNGEQSRASSAFSDGQSFLSNIHCHIWWSCSRLPNSCSFISVPFGQISSLRVRVRVRVRVKVEPTGQVAFTCPVPVGSIRQDTRSR